MRAPEGSVVHAVPPQPGTARHVVGMFLPNALLKALAHVKPAGAMAEGAGAVWTMQVNGHHDDGSPFITAMFTYAGGVGARATKPGLDACSYPTGVSAVPIEVVEASAPVRFLRKALRPGSGGGGSQPGGLGQVIEFEVDTARPWQLNAVTSRLTEPPQGIFGGEPGASGSFQVNGEPVTTQTRITLQPGDTVRLELPGGGGYGRPATSDPAGSGSPGRVVSTWAEPVSFASAWDRAVAGRADETFLVFETPSGDVSRWSYGDFDEAVDRVAGTLAALAVEPGAAVHLALTNSPTFVAAWLAASRLGAWIVPSDPMGRTPELAGHIERTRPAVGLCAGARAGTYRAATAEAGRDDLPVIEIDEADTTLAPFDAAPLAAAERPEPSLRDRAAVMFTSGTTGRPKGVEVTQANYAFAGKVMAEAAQLVPDDRQLVVLPLFHANAQYYSFASAIWTGASVALMPAFSASGFLPAAARHSATCASLFAAPIRMILARGGPVDGLRPSATAGMRRTSLPTSTPRWRSGSAAGPGSSTA